MIENNTNYILDWLTRLHERWGRECRQKNNLLIHA